MRLPVRCSSAASLRVQCISQDAFKLHHSLSASSNISREPRVPPSIVACHPREGVETKLKHTAMDSPSIESPLS